MRPLEPDPYCLPTSGCALDVLPSDREAAILKELRAGDRVVISQRGDGYQFERSLAKIRGYLITALLHKKWISAPHPDGPLFGDIHDGCLSPRGALALERWAARQ